MSELDALNKNLLLPLSLLHAGLHYFPILNRLYVLSAGVSFLEVDFYPPSGLGRSHTFTNTAWQEFSPIMDFTLFEGDGLKKVYVAKA